MPPSAGPVFMDSRLRGNDSKSGGDEAIDLAIAEQPPAAELDHLVVIGAPRADLGALRAVLHDGPVRTNIGRRFAVERDHDIGDHMDAARPVVAAPGADILG